jgi:hypothetical protein
MEFFTLSFCRYHQFQRFQQASSVPAVGGQGEHAVGKFTKKAIPDRLCCSCSGRYKKRQEVLGGIGVVALRLGGLPLIVGQLLHLAVRNGVGQPVVEGDRIVCRWRAHPVAGHTR